MSGSISPNAFIYTPLLTRTTPKTEEIITPMWYLPFIEALNQIDIKDFPSFVNIIRRPGKGNTPILHELISIWKTLFTQYKITQTLQRFK